MVNISQSLGLLGVYSVGALVHWRTVSWIFFGLNAVSFLLSAFLLPETPYYLINNHKEDEARASLKRLRGHSNNYLEDELSEIVLRKKTLDLRSEEEQGMLHVLASPAFVKPFLVIGVIYCASQLGGVGNLSMYLVTVFQESGTDLNPYTCSIIVSLARTLIACVSSFALRSVGRKKLFFASALVIAASLAVMGTVSYVKVFVLIEDANDILMGMLNYVPVICVMLIYSAHSFGYGAVIRVAIGESFPTEVRSVSSSLCLVAANITLAATGYLFPVYLRTLGFHGTFWLYGAVTLCVGLYGVWRIPESKGKSLVKLEEHYDKK